MCRQPSDRRSLIDLFFSTSNEDVNIAAVAAVATANPGGKSETKTMPRTRANCQAKATSNVVAATVPVRRQASRVITTTVKTPPRARANHRAKAAPNVVAAAVLALPQANPVTTPLAAISAPARIRTRRPTQQFNIKNIACLFCGVVFRTADTQIVCDFCIRNQ